MPILNSNVILPRPRDAIERLEIKNVSGPESVYVGEKFDEDFVVRLTSSGQPVEGLPVTVSYKELRANGRKTALTHTVLTDSEGLASFEAPAVQWVGNEKITFFLDMRAVIEPLEDVSF